MAWVMSRTTAKVRKKLTEQRKRRSRGRLFSKCRW